MPFLPPNQQRQSTEGTVIHNNSLRAMVGNWIGPPRDIYIRRLCQYSRPFPTTLVLPAERIDSRMGDATIAKRRGTKSRESDPRTTLN